MKKFFSTSLLLLYAPICIFSQNLQGSKKHLITFDSIIGQENTNLNYGILYEEKYKTKKGNHHFFKRNQFQKGSVNYQNEDFFNVLLKYDLADEHLIVKIKKTYKYYPTILSNSLIKEFKLGEHKFINDSKYGFLEILFDSDKIKLLKKHTKEKHKRLTNTHRYYKFQKHENLFFYYEKEFIDLKSKKKLYKSFTKEKIKHFYKQNSHIYRDNKDLFFIKLARLIASPKL
ncbi:hypothetical protein F7018_08960 [Tenacibaculum aiptasiae]|uniref:Uncharacterized protein n=1 Tax=Tenacibaculum aiptasiae TaxID=426481 RepID=A0A7J5AL76_9FLAO|nr:hypothetical protein [Tenacibaculum aiptasiae]KAB1158305.1 hypothetical protein F7018_08960 [Tenacibaculum aiptasiae]